MQTIKDAVPLEVIRAEFRKLSPAHLIELVEEIANYHEKKLIDDELHDYLLFQIMFVTNERMADV